VIFARSLKRYSAVACAFTLASRPPMIVHGLRGQADVFIDLRQPTGGAAGHIASGLLLAVKLVTRVVVRRAILFNATPT
jgi:hypothetical protein